MNSFVKELKKAREKRYLMVINRLKRLSTLPLRNLSLFTRVFGKNYGRGEIDSEEIRNVYHARFEDHL